jgi:nuclear pore complex protein Nup205
MEFFDPGAIEALVKQCEIISEEDVQLTKIALLQNRLRSELANLTNVALGQRQLIVQEVQNILSFVVQRNNIRLELSARRFYLEGWRQVLECLLATGSLNDLSYTHRWNILTQITQDIFSKCLAADNTLPDLVHYLSGVMVILLAGLRACALEGVGESGASSGPTKMPSDYVRCLDGTILRTPNGITVDLEKNIFTSYSFSFELSPLDCNCTWKFNIFGHSQCYSTPVS